MLLFSGFFPEGHVKQNYYSYLLASFEATSLLFRMAHSSFSLECESREILSSAWEDTDTSRESSDNEPNPGDGFRCKRSTEEKP